MSNLISSIVVGLGVTVSASSFVAVVGPYWPGSPTARAGQQDFGTPADPAPADGSAEAPPTSPTPLDEGDPPAPSRTVLLMKDGNVKVFDGPSTEDRLDYILTLDIGQIRIPKGQVEQRLGSLREAYEYQRTHLPDRDPDEHLRLARWCLTHEMPGEAAEQLRALLAWSPGDRTAEAMLRNIELADARRAARDSGVVRAGTDASRGGANEPRDLDDSVLRHIRAFRGRVPAPVIFDLDETLAVRRFQEYGQTVHRVLQIRCASCHDESSDRNFRLIRARDKKDLANAMLVRTNLDGTLALIDRSNPVYSPLLVNSVMPHGPDQKAIMHPNSPEYRAIWTWVESLRGDSNGAGSGNVAASGAVDPAFSPAAAPAGYPPQQPQGDPGTGVAPQATADPSFGGGFATQRPGPGVPGSAAIPGPNPMPMGGGGGPPAAQIGTPGNPHVQRIENSAVHPSVPDDLDFQTVSPLFGSSDDAATLSIDGRTIRPPGHPQGGPAAPAPMPPGAIPAPGPAPVPGGAPAPVPNPGQAPASGRSPAPGATPPPGFIMPPGASFPGAPAPPGGRPMAPAPGPVGAPVPGVPPGSAPAPGIGPAPALDPAGGNVLETLGDGSQIVGQADGSKMLRLPDGEMIPYLDGSAIDNAPAAGKGESSLQIDPALLERLQRRKMGNP